MSIFDGIKAAVKQRQGINNLSHSKQLKSKLKMVKFVFFIFVVLFIVELVLAASPPAAPSFPGMSNGESQFYFVISLLIQLLSMI